MDRLHALGPAVAVAVVLAGGLGCDETSGKGAAPPSRVAAVVKKKKEPPKLEEFCDVLTAADAAPAFAFPPLADAAPEPAGGWRWVNVWATWCKPCIEEMPMLRSWHQKLADKGTKVDLLFLSVDEEAEAVAAWRAANDGKPRGPRIASTEDLPEWLASLELDESAAIPIHVFVDGSGRRRCVRTGALSSHHYEPIAELVSQP